MSTTTSTAGIPQPIHDPAIADRLRIFRTKYVAESQNEAAKKLGVSQSALSYMEIRKMPIRYQFIAKLVRDYGLNQDWLITGNGSPKEKNPSKSNLLTDVNAINVELSNLTGYIKKMELNQKYLLKLISDMGDKIKSLEAKLEQKH